MTHYCGECKHFGYEDTYGVGSCLLRQNVWGEEWNLRLCDQPSCEDFEEEEQEE